MSKTLRYLADNEDFGAHHFKPALVFSKAPTARLAGHTKPFAQGGAVNPTKPRKPPQAHLPVPAPSGPKPLPNGGYAKGGKVQKMAMGGAPMPMGALSAPMGAPPMGAPGMGAPPPAPMAAPAPRARPQAPSVGAGPLSGGGPPSALGQAIGTMIGKEAVKKMLPHLGKHAHHKKGHKKSHAPKPRITEPAAPPESEPLPIAAAKGGHIAPKHPEMQISHNKRGGYVMHMKKGGRVPKPDGDAAQDRAMVSKGVHQHEGNMHKGEPKTALKLAGGGLVNRPPADPMTRRTARNITPGGEVPYGVEPSHEGNRSPITKLNDGGRVRR
jgi:hypothetical protein